MTTPRTKAHRALVIFGALSGLTHSSLVFAQDGASEVTASDYSGFLALAIAATLAWIFVLALVAFQFFRISRLSNELKRMEKVIEALEDPLKGEK